MYPHPTMQCTLLTMQRSLTAALLACMLCIAPAVQLAKTSAAPAEPDICGLTSRLMFKEGMVSDNNLGRVNIPNWMPASIRFGNVFPYSENTVDLVVSAASEYFGSYEINGVVGDFAVINLNCGASVNLLFSFVDRVTGVPTTVDPFHFTVTNLGRFNDQPGGAKGFSVTGIDGYQVSDKTNITVVTGEDGLTQEFTSSFVGVKDVEDQAPPRHDELTPAGLANSVTLQFPALSSFYMTLNVTAGMGNRRYHFGGVTNLVCEERALCGNYTCPELYATKLGSENVHCAGSVCSDLIDVSTCCEPKTPALCQSARSMTFTHDSLLVNNLGGFNHSLESGIRFTDVFPAPGSKKINLIIRNLTQYQNPDTVAENVNNVIGNYLYTHILANTSVVLEFSFINEHNHPIGIPFPFKLGISDFDTQANGEGQEQVEVDGFHSYEVTQNTSIKVFDEGSSVLFTATQPGTREDNPVDVYNQTREQLDKAVSVMFSPNTSSFILKARVNGGWAGRQLMMAGWSEIKCPSLRSYCTSFQCPAGYVHRTDEKLRCAGYECNEMDYDTCCMALPRGVCSAERRIQFARDSLIHNNLGGVGPDTLLPMIMRVIDVFPQSSKLVEMKVSVNGRYQVLNKYKPMNSLHGGFLKIDVPAGALLSLNIEFFDAKTKLMELGNFILTIASLHKGLGSAAVQSVTTSGFRFYNVSANSSIKVTTMPDPRGYNLTTFTGTAHAPLARDVPAASLHMDAKLLNSAVSLEYAGRVAASLDLQVGPGKGYRSFLIGGATHLACPTRLALCNTMLCPQDYKLKATAASLSCAGTACNVTEDLDTCCEPIRHALCDPSTELSLSRRHIVLSNLGGVGPDSGPPKLIYGDVFPLSDRDVDLEITNTTPYHPYDPKANGMHNGFGAISMDADTSTNFMFQLVDRETNTTLSDMGPYALSLVDLQAHEDHITGLLDGQANLSVPEATEFIVADRSFVRASKGHKFMATSYGALPSAPKSPWKMGVKHLRNAVELKMNSSAFHLRSQVGEGAQRRVLFTGPTNLACPARSYCDSLACPFGMVHFDGANSTPCKTTVCTEADTLRCCRYDACGDGTMLDLSTLLYNNLGGFGPDAPDETMPHKESMIMGNVFPMSGSNLNLVISVEPGTEYFPYHAERNGLVGVFGLVNIRAGSGVELRFTFIDAVTGEPQAAPHPSFFFTLSGIDQGDRGGIESVAITKSTWYTLPVGTALSATEDMDASGEVISRTFTSTTLGGTEGTMFNPYSLSGAILNHTVSVMMPAVERFHVKFSATMDWSGRNVLFAGASNLVCGRKATCQDFHCPLGTELKRTAHYRFCSGKRCYRDVDQKKCCDVVDDGPNKHAEPAGGTVPEMPGLGAGH